MLIVWKGQRRDEFRRDRGMKLFGASKGGDRPSPWLPHDVRNQHSAAVRFLRNRARNDFPNPYVLLRLPNLPLTRTNRRGLGRGDAKEHKGDWRFDR